MWLVSIGCDPHRSVADVSEVSELPALAQKLILEGVLEATKSLMIEAHCPDQSCGSASLGIGTHEPSLEPDSGHVRRVDAIDLPILQYATDWNESRVQPAVELLVRPDRIEPDQFLEFKADRSQVIHELRIDEQSPSDRGCGEQSSATIDQITSSSDTGSCRDGIIHERLQLLGWCRLQLEHPEADAEHGHTGDDTTADGPEGDATSLPMLNVDVVHASRYPPLMPSRSSGLFWAIWGELVRSIESSWGFRLTISCAMERLTSQRDVRMSSHLA